jgi:uncharacterized membrane protein (DUF2068 family)
MNTQLKNVAVTRNVKATAEKKTAKGIVELKKNSYIWRQTHLDENGNLQSTNINMEDMTTEHLIKASIKCQKKLIELNRQAAGWNDLLEKLNQIADNKGIELPAISY